MKNTKSNNSNTLLYKIVIGIMAIIILVLGVILIKNKGNISLSKTNYNNELTSENNSLKEEKEKLLSKIDTLNDKLKELENDDSSCDTTDLKNEISSLKDQVLNLNTSNEKLTSQVSNYKYKVSLLNITIKELNDKISKLNDEIIKLEEEKNTYTVFYSIDGKTVYTERVKKGENVKNIPSIPDKENYEKEWSNNGKNVQEDMVIYPRYYYLLTFKGIDDVAKVSKSTYKLYDTALSKELTINYNNIKLNDNIIVEATILDETYNGSGWEVDENLRSYGYLYEVTKSTVFEYYASTGCIAKGSKITMADGTLKNVEDIKTGDEVLGYNMYTGLISKTKVITFISDSGLSKVFEVKLANGNKLKIIDDEYLFDADSKKYIAINYYTYKSAIGKSVMVNDNGNISTSKIVSITYSKKNTEHYTLYTEKAINYIANDMIALAPFYYVNQRYTITDDYKIDMDIYNSDVNKYGVFSYDDFKDVCTKETFDNFTLKDYKIVVGKGLLTFEEFKANIKILQDEIDYYRKINK